MRHTSHVCFMMTAAMMFAACATSSAPAATAATTADPAAITPSPAPSEPALSEPAPSEPTATSPVSSETAVAGVCAVGRAAWLEQDGETSADVAIPYPVFSVNDYELHSYMDIFKVTKLDDTSANRLRLMADGEHDADADPRLVLKKRDADSWRVIAAEDIEIECPGAHTPWD